MVRGVKKGKMKLTDEELKANQKKYRTSEKGKAAKKKYQTGEKGKITMKNYRTGEKGKAAKKKYESSEKGKITMEKYRTSEKIIEQKREHSRKYEASEKGKASRKNYRTSEKGKERLKNYEASEKGHASIRLKILRYYSKLHSNSDLPCCRCCGLNSHIAFLDVDHIQGRFEMASIPELKKLKYSSLQTSGQLLRWIVDNNYLKDLQTEYFQILCKNCNGAKSKSKDNECPMKGKSHF
jgi:hypothetical protein